MRRRVTVARLASLCALLGAAPGGAVRAQCPDGSPPPCARSPRPRPPGTVAVLYFDNLSRDSGDVFLADGITEELMGRLAEVPRVQVRPRSLSQYLRERSLSDPAALGRLADAAYLVSGSVRRSGSRVRVTVDLTLAASRQRLWTRTIDAAGGDLLALEEAIAREVVAGIMGEMLPSERVTLARRATRDPMAHELYLRARFLQSRFTEADLRAAVALYEQALARDSGYAEAWVGLGQAWSLLADDFVTPREATGEAARAFGRALAIDTSASALGGMAIAVLALDYGPQRARSLAHRALELNSGLAEALTAEAFMMSVSGDFEQAGRLMRDASQRDSLSVFITAATLQTLVIGGHYDEILGALPRALLGMPASEVAGFEGIVRFSRGDCAGAVPLLTDARQAFTRFYLVPALVCAGRRAEAQAERDSLISARQRRYVPPSLIATAEAALGDLDGGFRWLEQARVERDFFPLGLYSLPPFAPLRGDPRWVPYRRALGMNP